ncbi:hypothetical protein JBE04_43595 [Streptomyces sp. PRKS01-29]|nr:hypothetical protein [Streptomyces sabulosicollis]
MDEDRRLDTVGEVKLDQEAADVRLDGDLAQPELRPISALDSPRAKA